MLPNRDRLRILVLALAASAPLALASCAASPAPPASVSNMPTMTPPAPPALPDVAFPSSPAGAAAAAWIHAVNDASRDETLGFYRTRYAKALLDERPAGERRDVTHELRATEGRRHVLAIEKSSETTIVALLQSELAESWQRLTIEVEPSPPYMIVRAAAEVISTPNEPAPRGDREASAILDAYVTRMCDRGLFSGAVAIGRNGTIIYERACGLASRAFGVPNRVDTKFNLGSMNKMFTAVSIAELVAAGKLSYGDTLAKAWPEYPNRAVAEKVTIHQLLTHTSGLGDYFTDEYDKTPKDKLRSVQDFLPLFADKPLEFEPGTRYRYSNAGFMVLGGVVQRISGQDYFDYVREHVYAPAGMKNTDAFEMDHDTSNLAIGYTPDRRREDGQILPGKFRNNLYLHVVKGGPAGGGFSTVGDLIAFGQALTQGKLVPPIQVATLTTSRGGPDPDYAYGFHLETFDGQRIVGHSGGFDGINAHLDLFPDSGLSIAAMANLDPPSAERITHRARSLFASVGRGVARPLPRTP